MALGTLSILKMLLCSSSDINTTDLMLKCTDGYFQTYMKYTSWDLKSEIW